jgi:tannase/feruloyl esterase
MGRLSLLALAALLSRGLQAQQPIVRDAAQACAALRTLAWPDVRITEASAAAPDTATRRWPGRMRISYCRVIGVIGRSVEFGAVLPNEWNGQLLMVGNGGFAGSFAPVSAANEGFLAITTNTGHSADGTDARWAFDDVERQVDYGYLAVHETAEIGKALARTYYGTDPRFAFFEGCSNGGRQALMEAERFPLDFDGILAGAPAYDFTDIGAEFLRNARANFPPPARLTRNVVTPENVKLLSAKVLEACDAIDGVKDGVIDDPRRCHFDLESIAACPDDHARPDCLTAAQRGVIATIYSPTRIEGREIYPGQPFGGEGEPGGWIEWITGARDANGKPQIPLQARFAIGFKYFVAEDSSWDYATYDLSHWTHDVRLAGTFLNATDPDLSAFAAHGGKLILFHGWSDPALNPLATIAYYERVAKRDPKSLANVRLYLLPGVLHCAGGAGPDQVAFLSALRDWVERDEAPDRLIASKLDRGRVMRTRPVCPYPQHAAYMGRASTDSASSFVCRND